MSNTPWSLAGCVVTPRSSGSFLRLVVDQSSLVGGSQEDATLTFLPCGAGYKTLYNASTSPDLRAMRRRTFHQ